MSDKFHLSIYSRRWGHNDSYSIKITDNGWDFTATMTHLSGECDKKGNPFVFKALDHESINYPKELDEYLEHLWYVIKEEGLSREEIQESLNTLADWINLCEKNSPSGIWKSFK